MKNLIKNLKVKKKLQLCFGILVILMLGISLLSISGLRSIYKETEALIEKTLVNTEYVWEMRRNMISEQRYELMAFAENDLQEIKNYLDVAQEEAARNAELLEQYKLNYRVEQSKVDELETCFKELETPRTKIITLLKEGTREGNEEAFQVFETTFKPLLDKQAELLADIGNDQDVLARKQAEIEKKTYWATIGITVFLIVLALIISYIVIRNLVNAITFPLLEIENAAHALSNGDFNAHITYDSADEMGETCKSMQKSFEKLKSIIFEISSILSKLGKGDLTTKVSGEFSGELKEIENSIHELVDNLNKTMSEIDSAANQIESGSNQISGGAQDLAEGATEQAGSVEELVATITEISRQVQENSENAEKANALAASSGDVARSTREDVNKMVTAMQEISEATHNIKKVIKSIEDIASQTNLLSLNATIEAARAGEMGRGFAVVADEVRDLAEKSVEAVKDTTALIESIIVAVSHGEEIAEKTSEVFDDLMNKVQEIASTIEEISAASREQAIAIQEISSGVDQISVVVQTNSASSEENAAASEELSGQAYILNNLVKRFKLLEQYDHNEQDKDVSL